MKSKLEELFQAKIGLNKNVQKMPDPHIYLMGLAGFEPTTTWL